MKLINKKKAVKLAISTAVVASAFVATTPLNQEAKASVNVNELIEDAQNAGVILKWAISVEGSADFKTRPYDEFNTAKKTVELAEKAIAGLPYAERLSAETKLVEPKIQLKRATNYIDAITSSEKIKSLTLELEKANKSGNLNEIEKSYHKATAEYRKQAILLDRVYGQSTRDGIRNAVKPQLEKAIAELKYDITVKTHLDKANALLQKSDYVNAFVELEKANYNLGLKQASFSYKSTLEKQYKEVYEAIPVLIADVVGNGKTEVTVKFNKEFTSDKLSTINLNAFKIKDLTVKSVKLSDDKKSVILTTANQESGKEYTLTWNQKTYNFITPKGENKAKIVFNDTKEAFLETTESRVYSSKLTNADGTPYIGSVSINLTKNKTERTNAVITTVNGQVLKTPSDTWTGTTDQNGNLVYTISASNNLKNSVNSATNVQPLVKTLNGDVISQYAPTTHFMKLQTTNVNTEMVVEDFHVDTLSDYVYANEFKWKWDSNDLFFVRGQSVTQDQFEKALSKGDKLTVSYDVKKENISTWNITVETTKTTPLSFTNPEKSNETTDLSMHGISGKAQSGNMIRLYRNGTFVDTTVVDSNGDWAVYTNLLENERNVFTAYQYLPGTDGENGKNSVDQAEVVLLVGAFASSQIELDDKTNDGLTINDEITFSFVNDDKGFNHLFKDNSKGTITISDGFGKKATISVVENRDGKLSKTLTIADFVNTDNGFKHDSEVFHVLSVEGFVNQDELKFNLDDSTSDLLTKKKANQL